MLGEVVYGDVTGGLWRLRRLGDVHQGGLLLSCER